MLLRKLTTNAAPISKLKSFVQLTRLQAPTGTILLYLPCTWSILLSSLHNAHPPGATAAMLALFGTGAFVMRSAGCVINDLWDRELDKKVARTRDRPIASGRITVPEGLAFLGGLLSIGLGILSQLNLYSIMLGASSLFFVTIYPLMKRVTYLPQLVLGLAFNWGALLGYPAIAGMQDWSAVLPLYASGICWTLIYDTIYAHQDIKDDREVGIKSTALLFGDKTKPVLSVLAAGQFGALTYLGLQQGLGVGYWMGGSAAAAYSFHMIRDVDIKSVSSCARWFRKSQLVGWLLAAGLGAEYVRRMEAEDPGIVLFDADQSV